MQRISYADGKGSIMYRVEQYVTAYSGDKETIEDFLPDKYKSLRPVLRINAEILEDTGSKESFVRIEFNTPVECRGKRGWLNLMTLKNSMSQISVSRREMTTEFIVGKDDMVFLDVEFIREGKKGGCPHEDDNEGTFFGESFTEDGEDNIVFIEAENIDEKKELCRCKVDWILPENDRALSGWQKRNLKEEVLKRVMRIKTDGVLGAYVVEFMRNSERKMI